jgi:hypothetical protein
MSSGGSSGAAAFSCYRAFQTPMMVHVGKRGITARALGVGEIVVHGNTGAEVVRCVCMFWNLRCLCSQ